MKLEQQMYEIPRIKERIYQIRDLENLSATALHYGEGGGSSGGFGSGAFGSISKRDIDKYGIVTPKIKFTPNTAYFPLLRDVNQTIGVTHHS